MGDRCNIVIEYEKGERIYFYGHWSGEDYANAVQRALAKRQRWDDAPYLARIIWDEFCPERGRETGFGISPYECDNEHPILVVNPGDKTVTREAYRDLPAKRWAFEEWANIKLDAAELIAQ